MAVEERTKTCGKCRVEKPVDQFPKHVRGLYGVEGTCKVCRKANAAVEPTDVATRRKREWRKAQQVNREHFQTALTHDPDPSWRERAACRNKPNHLWFPESVGGRPGPDSQHAKDVRAALAICNDECPVRGSCLQFALTTRQDEGLWGGATPEQRRRMRKTGRAS